MRVAAIIVVLLSVCFSSYSQDIAASSAKRQPYIHVLYHSGIFWSRTEYLQEQFDAGSRGFEARIGFQTTGYKDWHQLSNYPKIGFGVQYADLVKGRKDSIVGNPFSAFAFYSAPIARFGRFTFNTDLSVGLSYSPIVHDPFTNPYNDVIASHINLFLDFNFNMQLSLSNRFDMNVGYGLTHHSNGRIHMPQKGVNIWGWSMGLSYQLNEQVAEFTYRELPEFEPWNALQFMVAIGTVEVFPLGETEGTRYFTSSFTSDYAFNFNPKMAVTFGIDVLFDGSLEYGIKGIPPEKVSTFQKMYLGSHLGYQYTVHRLTLLFNLGTYFRQYTNDRGFWFTRVGGRIRITDHLYVHIAIKSKNGVRSDWIEWGAAYHLKIR